MVQNGKVYLLLSKESFEKVNCGVFNLETDL